MYEVDYSDNILLVGEFEFVDTSFDHEFGCEYCEDIEVKNLEVHYVLNERKRDITNLVIKHDAKFYSWLEDYFYAKALEKYF